jgi:hypothetical protein
MHTGTTLEASIIYCVLWYYSNAIVICIQVLLYTSATTLLIYRYRLLKYWVRVGLKVWVGADMVGWLDGWMDEVPNFEC